MSREKKMKDKEDRKWEDLGDCLVHVFAKVGMESLLLDVPLVCKSWHQASSNPQCWQRIVFPPDEDPFWGRLMDRVGNGYWFGALFDLIVKLCEKKATELVFQNGIGVVTLSVVLEMCPNIRTLSVPHLDYDEDPDQDDQFPKSLAYVKGLQELELEDGDHLIDTVTVIGNHCKNFERLIIPNATVGEQEASAIITHLPKIKHLSLRGVSISKGNLEMILKGCEELEYLDVSDGDGFVIDDKTLKLASHVGRFMH